MAKAQEGQLVTVHYGGTLEDGSVFDSSVERDQPIEFVLGGGQMIPGFEEAVMDMEIGETKKVHLTAAQAYGEYREDAVQPLPKSKVGQADELHEGDKIPFKDPKGHIFVARIAKIDDDNVYIDFNHELAGKDLDFEITLVDAQDADDISPDTVITDGSD